MNCKHCGTHLAATTVNAGFSTCINCRDYEKEMRLRVVKEALVDPDERVGRPDPPPPGDGERTVPPPSNPMAVARMFVSEHDTDQRGESLLRHHRGDFHRWDGACWPEAEARRVRKRLYAWLESAVYEVQVKAGTVLIPWDPNRRKIADVVDALQAVTHLAQEVEEPAWLEPGPVPAGDVVAVANGLLHVPTRTLYPHSPTFWTHHALPFDFDSSAPQPERWVTFLDELWDGDAESVSALQELFGYIVSGATRLQKIALIVGPKRAGKGTIGRVLTGIAGRQNVAAPTFAGMATNFGLSPLIGRPLALVSDARLSGKTDANAVVERLLSISGEDSITIDRKYREPWTGRLPTRFVILTNELPRLTDSSGALASRFLIFVLTKSFYGREDPNLTDELLAEAPGILNWALDGMDRLNARGYFEPPASSVEAVRQLEDLASPVGAFVRERCLVGPAHSVEVEDLWRAWRSWCATEGREHAGTKATFGRDLRAAYPQVRKRRPGTEPSDRRHVYEGLRVLDLQSSVTVTRRDVEPESAYVTASHRDAPMQVQHELDPAILESILAGHRYGRTPEQIADTINGNGFAHPTGGRWMAMDVRKVLGSVEGG